MCRPCSLAVCYFSLPPPLFPSLPPYVDFCQFSLSIHVGQFTGVPCFLSSWTSLPHIYHVFPSFSRWSFGVRLDEKGCGNSCKGLWPLPLSIKRGGLKFSLKLCIVGIRSCQTDTAGLSSFLPSFCPYRVTLYMTQSLSLKTRLSHSAFCSQLAQSLRFKFQSPMKIIWWSEVGPHVPCGWEDVLVMWHKHGHWGPSLQQKLWLRVVPREGAHGWTDSPPRYVCHKRPK